MRSTLKLQQLINDYICASLQFYRDFGDKPQWDEQPQAWVDLMELQQSINKEMMQLDSDIDTLISFVKSYDSACKYGNVRYDACMSKTCDKLLATFANAEQL